MMVEMAPKPTRYASPEECEICREIGITSWARPDPRLHEPPDPTPLGKRADLNTILQARLRCPLCGAEYDYERECGFQQDDHKLVRVSPL